MCYKMWRSYLVVSLYLIGRAAVDEPWEARRHALPGGRSMTEADMAAQSLSKTASDQAEEGLFYETSMVAITRHMQWNEMR